jgi:acid phosphatase type 7
MKHLLCLALFVLQSAAALAQSDVIGVYLTWQRDPTTTMTVNWVNLYPGIRRPPSGIATARRRSGRAPPAPSAWSGPSTLQVRRVELTGLKPDTLHEFVLAEKPGPRGQGSATLSHAAGHAEPAAAVRVTGGDMMHNREYVDTMNKRAAALDPDFAILGGDLAYANDVDATRWVDWIQSWSENVKGKDGRAIPMIVGHRQPRGEGRLQRQGSRTTRRTSTACSRCPRTGPITRLDAGDYLSVVVLDSDHTQPIAGPQADWLGEALARRAQSAVRVSGVPLAGLRHDQGRGGQAAVRDGALGGNPHALDLAFREARGERGVRERPPQLQAQPPAARAPARRRQRHHVPG